VLLVLSFVYFPGYYNQKLKIELLAEKESEILEWSKDFSSKLVDQNIIAEVNIKTEEELDKERQLLQTKELQLRKKNIEEINEKIAFVNSSSLKDDPKIKSRISRLKEDIRTIENKPFPEVYKYSNLDELAQFIFDSYGDQSNIYYLVFYELQNIELSAFQKMSSENRKSYLYNNAIFSKIIDTDVTDKNTITIKPGDEEYTHLVNTFLLEGRKAQMNQSQNLISYFKLLDPPEKQMCLLISDVNFDRYFDEMNTFYNLIMLLLAFLILLTPVIHIYYEHRLRIKLPNKEKANFYGDKWLPSYWLIIRGSLLFDLAIPIAIVLGSGMLIFTYIFDDFNHYQLFSFVFTGIFLLLISPNYIKSFKAKRLFKRGEEIECVYRKERLAMNYRGSRIYINTYSYDYNGETYSVKAKRMDDQKGFIANKSKLTALVDPAKPNRAIVKDNFLPSAESINYEISAKESDLQDFCIGCNVALEPGKREMDVYEYFCPNCSQVMNALDNEPKILDSYNKGDWKSIDFVCSVCSTKLEFDDSEPDSNQIHCPDCNWSMKLDKNIESLNAREVKSTKFVCPYCSTRLELEDSDIKNKMFICPACYKNVNL
jgi:DNA-directed RNA polymerase subunit RPC12/RpoP